MGENPRGPKPVDRNIPIVEQRLSVAGVRLAALLNAVFDGTKELPSELSEPPEVE